MNNGDLDHPSPPTMMDAHARIQASLPYQRWRHFFETVLQTEAARVEAERGVEWEIHEKTIMYNEWTEKRENECSICLENFLASDLCTCLEKCQHLFHTECLHKAVQHHHRHCPQCRGEICIRSKQKS